jgi:hypothetical protein
MTEVATVSEMKLSCQQVNGKASKDFICKNAKM